MRSLKRKPETLWDPSYRSIGNLLGTGASITEGAEAEMLASEHSGLAATLKAIQNTDMVHILLALYVDGIPMEQIAEEDGIALGTVRSRSYRGRAKLLGLVGVQGEDVKHVEETGMGYAALATIFNFCPEAA